MSQQKQCKTCLETKELVSFERNSSCRSGYSGRCLSCKQKQSKVSYSIHKEKYLQKGKENYPNRYKKELDKYSGNWEYYFKKLLTKPERSLLTLEDCLSLLEKQKGLCALSGIPLTCIRIAGKKISTNASIDRVVHGGAYTLDNIRLVTTRVNTMRLDMSDIDLLTLCECIIAKAKVVKNEPLTIEMET